MCEKRDDTVRSALTQERLDQLTGRIDLLDAHARAGARQVTRVTRRRVAGLRVQDAAARAAVRAAAATAEWSLLQLETRVDIAERAAAADVAKDVKRFLGAATEELQSWGVYLERLQLMIATRAGRRRERCERALGELRGYRNTLDARVREVPCASAESWRAARERVQAARDELELRAAEVEATLAEGKTG